MRKLLFALLALTVLSAALVSAQPHDGQSSPTTDATANQFTEQSDLYLNVLRIAELEMPVFMLNVSPSIDPSTYPWFGFGAWWGPLYTGVHYGFGGGVLGNLAANNSVVQNQNDALIMDASGLVPIGTSSVVTRQVNYTETVYQAPVLVGGYRLGDMVFGVRNAFTINSSTDHATFDLTGTQATSTTTTVAGNDGAVSYLNSTRYATAEKPTPLVASYVSNDLQAGLTMPLAFMNMELAARFGLSITGSTVGGSYASEGRVVQTGAGYAAYTPAVSLPGETAAAIANLQAYDYGLANSVYHSTDIAPSLFGQVSMPIDILGGIKVRAGLEYTLGLVARSGIYADLANAALNVAGRGSNSRTIAYDATLVGGYMQTVTTDTRAYAAYTYSADIANTISLPLGVSLEPSDAVRFSLGFTPTLSFQHTAYAYAGGSQTTTLTNNGQPATTADYTVSSVAVTTNQPYNVVTDVTYVNLAFNTGVQFFVQPGKFRVNLGASGNVNVLSRDVTETTYTGVQETVTTTTSRDGVVTVSSAATLPSANEVSEVTDEMASANLVYYRAGFTYFLNPALTIDFLVTDDAAFNLGDTSNTGGFLDLANYSIQLTIQLPPAN